jgi:hypothetical protein
VAGCTADGHSVQAIAASFLPSIDPTSLLLSVDAGRLDVTGHNLQGAVLRWRSVRRTGRAVSGASGAASAADRAGAEGTAGPATSEPPTPEADTQEELFGSDICRDPQAGSEGLQACSFSIDRHVSADPAELTLHFYPAGVGAEGEVKVYDSQGRTVPQPPYAPARILLSRLVPLDSSLDAQAESATLRLTHPEAIGSVECVDALCRFDGNSVEVRGEHGSDETLDVRFGLRPHVYLQDPSGTQSSFASVSVALQRCPISFAGPQPLRGMGNQKVVMRVGGRCAHEKLLRFSINGQAAPLLHSVIEGESLYAVLQLERLAADDLSVVLQRGSSVVGTVHGQTQILPALRTRLELPGFGPIDFVPTNREATVLVPTLPQGGQVVPRAVEGVYSVRHDAANGYHLQGHATATGWVALRLVMQDQRLPPSLRELALAEFTENIDHGLRAANVPITLAAHDTSLVELLCSVDDHGPRRQVPGHVSSVPFERRDSCHLVLHREKLEASNGQQALRIVATVQAVDGQARPEALIDQVVHLRPSSTPREVFFGGVVAPFDRVVVRVSVLADDPHYSVATEEKIGAPPLQWSLIMGTSKVRFFATTVFPTGLFRIADKGHSGILALNSGVLFRFVGLSSEGRQTPVGLEAGVMWLGIIGDQTTSTLGQVGLVGGLSISVPLANVSRFSQASISLHAWAEYEVSRALLKTGGRPWGFVFGPSLSLGDVGVNF